MDSLLMLRGEGEATMDLCPDEILVMLVAPRTGSLPLRMILKRRCSAGLESGLDCEDTCVVEGGRFTLAPIYLVATPASPHVPREINLSKICFWLDFLINLKSVKSSSKKAKESCTDKSTMVARNSDPGIFWFTQSYAGRNEKEESPYRWENCLGSMPGMVAKLGSTAKANCSEIKFCGETSARQGCAEAGEELMPRSRSRQWNCRT